MLALVANRKLADQVSPPGAVRGKQLTVVNNLEFILQDILTPANLLPLFTSHPELIPSLFPHLPPDLPNPPSAEVLEQVVSSPQFRSAVRSFDIALSTGALQDFVRSLGLPEAAGSGFEAFLRAIQQQAEQESNETMDTD